MGLYKEIISKEDLFRAVKGLEGDAKAKAAIPFFERLKGHSKLSKNEVAFLSAKDMTTKIRLAGKCLHDIISNNLPLAQTFNLRLDSHAGKRSEGKAKAPTGPSEEEIQALAKTDKALEKALKNRDNLRAELAELEAKIPAYASYQIERAKALAAKAPAL
jgi:hypothetical protein